MSRKNLICVGLTALVIAALGIASAEEQASTGIKLGPGLRLESGLDTEIQYTDNMYYSAGNEVDSTGFLIKPEVTLSYEGTSSKYRLGYLGEWAEYDVSSEDDYQDNEVLFKGELRPLAKHRFNLDASYKRGHDAFGTDRTQALVPVVNQELDIWDRGSVDGRYTFGGSEATLNLYFKGGVSDKEYATNRTATRFLDYQRDHIGAGAIYKFGPKTRLLFDYEHANIDYDTDIAPSLDGDSEQILVGIGWAATAKTTGQFLIGHYSRDFDDGAREDGSGVSWKGKITWNPRVRTLLSLETGQTAIENVLLGEDFIDRRYLQLEWRQDWTTRLNSDVTLAGVDDSYEGTIRNDDYLRIGTSLSYTLSRMWTVKGGLEYTDRDSTVNNFDYDRNIVFIGLDGSF